MTDMELEHRTYRPGEVIFLEGAVGDAAYMVVEGRVEITVKKGDAELVINLVPPGEMFGEMALIDHSARMATARATSKTTCVVLPKEAFEKALRDSPPMLVAVIRTLLSRLRQGGKSAKSQL